MKSVKKVYIEITNGCNFSCSFCKASTRTIKYLSIQEFQHIIGKISPFTKSVYFHVLGEPLLHPEIGKFLDICNENRLSASITTNGSLIKKQEKNLIGKKALRQINYSLHSLMENSEDWTLVIKDILEFIKENQLSLYHCLRLWNLSSGDEKDNHLILKQISDYLGEEITFLKEEITKGHGIKIKQNVYLQQQERFVWPEINGEEIFKSGKCRAIRHDIAILSDGTVVPCCLDAEGAMKLGNIFEKSLGDILESDRAKNIYNGFGNGKVVEPFCKTCGFACRNFSSPNNAE